MHSTFVYVFNERHRREKKQLVHLMQIQTGLTLNECWNHNKLHFLARFCCEHYDSGIISRIVSSHLNIVWVHSNYT